MQEVVINAELREESGKKAAKAIRAKGRVPVVVYSKDKNACFSVEPYDVKQVVYTPEFKLAVIKCGDKSYRCIMKDIQMHPVTDKIMHIDFQELVDGHMVNLQIPIRLEGTSVGQKDGGQLIQLVRKLSVKALPSSLVDHVTLDISELELGHSVRVRDIKVIEGIQIMNDPGMPVGSVVVPRALKSATAAEEGEEGTEEGEEATTSTDSE